MWKWLSAAALIYGLIAVAFVCSPRGVALARLMDIVTVSKAWQQHPDPVPPLHDFEQPIPPPHTIPESPTEVIEQPLGGHCMRWQPDANAPVNVFGLPIRQLHTDDDALQVAIRGKGLNFILIGVREQDGSLYGALRPVGTEWTRLVVPLATLSLAFKTTDENASLDPEQINSAFIAVLSRDAVAELTREADRGLRQKLKEHLKNQQPGDSLELELDDFGLIPRDGIPGGGPPGPGGQGRGEPGTGPPGENPRGADRPRPWRDRQDGQQPPPDPDGEQRPRPGPGR